MADIPTEQAPAASHARGIDRAWLIRTLPGFLGALLFLALVTGDFFLGRAAGITQALLALLLAGAIAAQPPLARALRRAVVAPSVWHAAGVAGVAGLALFLRVWGLRFGLPYLEHPDEWAVADRALQMLRSGDYSPHSFVYPTLYTYLQLGIAGVHFLWGVSAGLYRTLADIDPARYYAWARALTALLGTGAVLGTYAAGRMLYGHATGLLAAAFLAVYPAAAGDAHYVTTDTPSMFFAVLAFLMIGWLGTRPPARRHDRWALTLIAGLCSGLALATKYNVAVLVAPLLLAVVMATWETNDHRPTTNDQRPTTTDQRPPTNDDERPTTDHRPTTNDQRPTTNDQRPTTTDDERPTTDHRPPTTDDEPGIEGSGLRTQNSKLKTQNSACDLRLAIWCVVLALLGILLGFTLGTPAWLRELPRLLDDVASVVVHYKFTGHPGAESLHPWLDYWAEFSRNAPLLAWAFLGGTLLAFVRHRRADLLVLSFAVPYFLQLASLKVVFFRNAMPLLPFLCLLAAALITDVARRLPAVREQQPRRFSSANRRSPAIFLAIALALLAAQPLALAAHDDWLRAQPTTRVLATEWMTQHASDGTRIWLEDQTLVLPSRLRVQGGLPVTTHDIDWYRANGFRYLVVNEDARVDDRAQLARFGAAIARFEDAGLRLGPTLAVYDTGPADLAHEPRTASGATLGGGAITLDGYHHPAEAQAGAVLPLALYWRVGRALPIDYTVYVHLLDSNGSTVTQRDLQPLEGSLPTSRWKPGDLIRDDQDLALPQSLPPGSYKLVVGMYDARTLAPINDAGPIDVGVIVVKP